MTKFNPPVSKRSLRVRETRLRKLLEKTKAEIESSQGIAMMIEELVKRGEVPAPNPGDVKAIVKSAIRTSRIWSKFADNLKSRGHHG